LGPKRSRWLPQCHWPHFFMQIKYNGDVIPCCCFRLGRQYTEEDDGRCVGNVLKTSVCEVWNSPEYRRVRRLVCNPSSSTSDGALAANFCYECPRLFETNFAALSYWGKDHTFEELYALGPEGRPIRRRALALAEDGGASPSKPGVLMQEGRDTKRSA